MGGGISKESLSSLTEHIPSLGGYHCAMIGLDSAGKTTVLYRLKYRQYVNTAPTIGFNTEKVRLNGSTFTVWDVGGQDKLRPLWRSYTRCTDGIIFVIDSTKEDRLEEAKLELQKICKSTMNGTGMKKNSIPVLVLANMQDLPDALDADKLESLLSLKDLGNMRQWHLQPTCAITGEGLQEGMEKLQEMITTRRKTARGPATGFGPSSGIRSNSSTKLNTKKLQRSHSHVY